MAELNLTTEDIITSVIEHEMDLLYEAAQGRDLPYGPEGIREAFRRWLAAHDREVKAEALREVARHYWGVNGDPDYPSTSGRVRRILNLRANGIERGIAG